MAKIRLSSFRPENKFREYISAEVLYQMRETNHLMYRKIFRAHLYCPILDCKARLRHHRPKNGLGNAYFSTWPKDEHKKGCSYAFERTPGGGVTIVEDTDEPNNVIVINKKRAKDIMKRALAKKDSARTESAEKTDGQNPKEANRSKQDPNISQVVSFDENGVNSGKKRNVVRYVTVDDLSDALLGKLVCVTGNLSSIRFGKDYGYLNANDSKNNDVFSVVFNERFSVEFPGDFHRLSRITKDEFSLFCSIGNLTKSKAGKYQVYPETPWLIGLFESINYFV
ncbi:hypothetical protein AAFJ72_14755 [Brevibacillus gelatini]|uniref:hypothetical protein n=1 Tax=Brevibacillus gelatini TaxID=1655277 RepID=UPI003D81B4DF